MHRPGTIFAFLATKGTSLKTEYPTSMITDAKLNANNKELIIKCDLQNETERAVIITLKFCYYLIS